MKSNRILWALPLFVAAVAVYGKKQGVALPAQNVFVTNDSSKPVPVDTGDDARNELQFSVENQSAFAIDAQKIYTVPTGYTFVVDSFSTYSFGGDYTSVFNVYQLYDMDSHGAVWGTFNLGAQAEFSDYDCATGTSGSMKFYVEAGRTLIAFGESSPSADTGAQVDYAITGHLVPVDYVPAAANHASSNVKAPDAVLRALEAHTAKP